MLMHVVTQTATGLSKTRQNTTLHHFLSMDASSCDKECLAPCLLLLRPAHH